ncbi:DUF1203 domain-containing protein [Tabrizicola caldifontis]|uniref:DUF1203 domain-containing protein n=1 Tax=Tabrizicola caldifontis TaxID=2528036 RepID=UPI001081E911|nr:DUF1203 domain-containing protein [Rhodobacter sp. YIM 73028]
MQFIAIPTDQVRALQTGGRDAFMQLPERRVSDGVGVPCRHCLKIVPAGQSYLILSHRPFAGQHPYAEQGPIFLCAEPCANGSITDELPAFLLSDNYIVRGYGPDERIVYGTGRVTPRPQLMAYCAEILARDEIAFAHIRSATNNCYLVRVERANSSQL